MASLKSCAACTFDNPLTATVCEVCNTPFAASTTIERRPTTGEEWDAAQRQDAAHQEAIQETYKVLEQLQRHQDAEAATKAMLEQEAASLASQNASFRSRDPRLATLVQKMYRELPGAFRDLEVNGKKTRHWAWWAWPTEKEGFSEPMPRTAVTRDSAAELIERAPREWQLMLEKVCELVGWGEKGFNGVIPSIDWNRIRYFVLFWNTVPESPPWLKDGVIPCLRQALTKSYGGGGGGSGLTLSPPPQPSTSGAVATTGDPRDVWSRSLFESYSHKGGRKARRGKARRGRGKTRRDRGKTRRGRGGRKTRHRIR